MNELLEIFGWILIVSVPICLLGGFFLFIMFLDSGLRQPKETINYKQMG